MWITSGRIDRKGGYQKNGTAACTVPQNTKNGIGLF